MASRIVRSRAPLRISFCGGGTDVSPYPEERGGAVISATINKYAFSSLVERKDEKLTITSLDYDVVAKYSKGKSMAVDSELGLVRAVAERMSAESGFDLFIHTDAPPGSGLGSSSTMVVSLIGTFVNWLKTPLTDYGIAELAYEIERVGLGIAGGRQDQYAATFGGFNFIEFGNGKTVVNSLRMKPSVINELEYGLLLCYTGKTRLSANIVARQTRSYIERKEEVVRALDAIKQDAIVMKDLLLLGKLSEFGELLHLSWGNKKKLDKAITDESIDELYDVARKNGAIGGKILGAGGGGYLLLFCDFGKKHIVAERLEELGGQIVEFGFEFRGLDTWEVG
ncbi:MAG: GHMP kinase [Candidatus Eisenbacteria bacterium]|nr:GHMP kinase [Candidatus Eisenbacteria bacterium]